MNDDDTGSVKEPDGGGERWIDWRNYGGGALRVEVEGDADERRSPPE